MVESGIAERIAARRAELDELEDQLAKQLEEVRAEHDELAVAEHVDTVADTQEQEDQIGLLGGSGRASAGRTRVSPTASPRSSRRTRR